MLRLLLLPALLLTALFGLALGALHLQPVSDPSAAFFDQCAVPCWKGVEPGQTQLGDAVDHFNAVSGVKPSRSHCFLSSTCISYAWMIGGTQTPAVILTFNQGQVATVDSYSPGLTLGEVLMALHARHIEPDGGDLGFVEGQHQLNVFLHFAHNQLLTGTVTDCPSTYLDLMNAPVRFVEFDAPLGNVQFPPSLTFGALQQRFNQLCGSGGQ